MNSEPTKQLQVLKPSPIPINEIMTIGKAFVESGMFPDVKSAAQAVVKIQAGQEIGIAPFAAMTGIHIIQGKPTIGAGLIASKVKSSGKYDYKVIEMTDKNCSLEFFEAGKSIGISSFSIEDAKKAETKNLAKFPKNMLFARAISNGVKWFAPDVFSAPIYTAEEMEGVQKTEDVTAEVTTKEDPHSVVTEPSDIDKEDKNGETIPGHWYAKIEKCKTPADVDALGTTHKETINANHELRKLFVKRKSDLKPVVNNHLPF